MLIVKAVQNRGRQSVLSPLDRGSDGSQRPAGRPPATGAGTRRARPSSAAQQLAALAVSIPLDTSVPAGQQTVAPESDHDSTARWLPAGSQGRPLSSPGAARRCAPFIVAGLF